MAGGAISASRRSFARWRWFWSIVLIAVAFAFIAPTRLDIATCCPRS